MKKKKISVIVMAILTITLIGLFVLPASYTSRSAANVMNVTDSIKAIYTCPMHPEVTSDTPGQCPKCGMDLELKKTDDKQEGMNCPNMAECKAMGCKIDNCNGMSGGCSNNRCMKNDVKQDNSNGCSHKSGCKKGC